MFLDFQTMTLSTTPHNYIKENQKTLCKGQLKTSEYDYAVERRILYTFRHYQGDIILSLLATCFYYYKQNISYCCRNEPNIVEH